jgi:hypothetical protein
MNRLASETSPYLLQHAENPVDWYAWGDEPFQKAKAEDKPILLSVGYSACHWCHVMAHESFEHAPTAEAVRKSFWLAHQNITAKWDRPIHNWELILNQLAIRFEERMPL